MNHFLVIHFIKIKINLLNKKFIIKLFIENIKAYHNNDKI